MTEQQIDKNYIKLSEFCSIIDNLIKDNFRYKTFNVFANITKVNVYSSVIYITMYEGNPNGSPYQFTGIIWSNEYDNVLGKLKSVGLELKEGLQAVFKGTVTFHSKNGLGFKILDVDIKSTIGELELKKREIRNKLYSENIFDNNKKVKIPFLIKNIAVICSKDSAGLSDFNRILSENELFVKLHISYFYSLVQGINAQREILNRFQSVRGKFEEFDLLVLIRGGGSSTDLEVFNDYELAKAICDFPIPVFTGIGHSTDKNILDEVANTSFDTPSKLAQFINDKNKTVYDNIFTFKQSIFENATNILSVKNIGINDFVNKIQLSRITLSNKSTELNSIKKLFYDAKDSISDLKSGVSRKTQIILSTQNRLNRIQSNITSLKGNISSYTKSHIADKRFRLEEKPKNIKTHVKHLFEVKNVQLKNTKDIIIDKAETNLKTFNRDLETLDKTINILSPDTTLKRGYSLTFYKNKILRNIEDLKIKDNIETIVSNGKIESIISNLTKEQK